MLEGAQKLGSKKNFAKKKHFASNLMLELKVITNLGGSLVADQAPAILSFQIENSKFIDFFDKFTLSLHQYKAIYQNDKKQYVKNRRYIIFKRYETIKYRLILI